MPFIAHNEKRILFVHIPKTGGTSVERWLSSLAPLHFRTMGVPVATRCTPQHFRMSDLNHLFGAGFFDYAFAIVRNPFSRIESEYRMRAQLQSSGFFGEAETFSSWLEIAIERTKREPWLFDNHMRPQWEFIEDNVEVFRFEDGLSKAVRSVCDRIGVPFNGNVEHALRTDESIPAPVWQRTDMIRVQQHYARDFERFGYNVDISRAEQ